MYELDRNLVETQLPLAGHRCWALLLRGSCVKPRWKIPRCWTFLFMNMYRCNKQHTTAMVSEQISLIFNNILNILHIVSRMPPYILFVHKTFACPDIHLYVLAHSNIRIECMQSKADDRWLFLLVRRDEIDCILFQVVLFFGIRVRPHINIHNVYANTWQLGKFLNNFSWNNYCKSCHSAGERGILKQVYCWKHYIVIVLYFMIEEIRSIVTYNWCLLALLLSLLCLCGFVGEVPSTPLR